ncbi:MAG TPA: peroxiredoxin [Candidatus Binataceae bacterium]|nr:peroxiredoxin [Candidatus Binataceae bacterium]
MLKVGDIAPDFTATTDEGKPLSLNSLRGSKVLLWFYPKADTPGCTAEGCSLRDNFDHYQSHGVQILGVSVDSVADNAAFVKKFSFPFRLLCDTDRSISVAYGACEGPNASRASRISYLIDEQGKIERAYPGVNPREHAAQVLSDLHG